jgi:hypothetical protein
MYTTKSYEVAATINEVFRSIAVTFLAGQFDNPEEIVDFFMAHLPIEEMSKVEKLLTVNRRGTTIRLGSREALPGLAQAFGNALNHTYCTQPSAKNVNYITTIVPDMIETW